MGNPLRKNADLGLDNGDKAVSLADSGVAGEAVCAVTLSDDGRASGDGNNGAPLSEASASLVVLGASLGEAVKALAPGLAVGAGEGNQSLVNLQVNL